MTYRSLDREHMGALDSARRDMGVHANDPYLFYPREYRFVVIGLAVLAKGNEWVEAHPSTSKGTP